MIIELLLDALFGIFSILTTPIKIPAMPNEVTGFIDEAFSYISSGVGILANYTNISYLLTLFGIIVAIDIGVSLYHFIMWILKKIPMLSIK